MVGLKSNKTECVARQVAKL